MAVLLLAGPVDQSDAQKYLESQIFQKLSDLGSDTYGDARGAFSKNSNQFGAD
ncbi:MAG: hypothetical protein AB9917_07380 [Negativicutes bacterium]